MQAGRELDKLVAEKVFGQEVKISTEPYELSKYGLHPGTYYIHEGWLLRSYSTDIAISWNLLEMGLVESVVRLSDGRWFARSAQRELNDECTQEVLKCGYSMCTPEGGYYEIPIYEKRSDGAIATTAPLAICLAALKALNVPIPS